MVDRATEQPGDLRDTVRRVLDRNRLAVLATQCDGQPHASLMAFTPLQEGELLVFATYRDTLKYESLRKDRRVAILIEDRAGDATSSGGRLVLTALGEAIEASEDERQARIATHLARHPNLEDFLRSPECELVCVAVHAYQVVGGIEDVRWYKIR